MRLTGMTVKWKLMLAAVAASLAVLIAACASPAASNLPPGSTLTGTFKVIGSNTVTPISSIWAENFMKANPKVGISVSGPGSGVGIAAFIDGTTDICQASRPMTAAEIDYAKANGHIATEIVVAYDGLAIFVNPANPIKDLTMEQLARIYTGKVTNWKDVGGKDGPIVAIARDSNSGTHVFFKEHVLQMTDKKVEYGSQVLFLPSTGAGVTEVSKNGNAISYAGLGYVTKDIKVVPVKKDAASPGVLPSIATVHDKSYPVSRPLFFYTDGAPQGAVKAFIDYCLGKDGQAVVAEQGFVPLT